MKKALKLILKKESNPKTDQKNQKTTQQSGAAQPNPSTVSRGENIIKHDDNPPASSESKEQTKKMQVQWDRYTETYGGQALWKACENGNTGLVRFLIEQKGYSVDKIDNYGKSCLSYAAEKQHYETMQLLIEKGAQIDQVDQRGTSILMYASESGLVKVVKLLLTQGADINLTDDHGLSSLMYACQSKRFAVVRHLLKKNAQVNLFDCDGLSALAYACWRCFWKGIILLFEYGGAWYESTSGSFEIQSSIKLLSVLDSPQSKPHRNKTRTLEVLYHFWYYSSLSRRTVLNLLRCAHFFDEHSPFFKTKLPTPIFDFILKEALVLI